jgi:hydroxymethylpyrimidine pyrophosphatase-like HAD family hydrolase
MYRRIFAFDFDGTLAENGAVPQAVQKALEHLHSAGCALFLVTGRLTNSVVLGSLADIFTGIVWENGAVLVHTATGEIYLPYGQVDPLLVIALEKAGVPLEHGRAIVSTWNPHDQTVWQEVNRWAGEAAVVHNKGAVMILPPGASKGTGLRGLLHICGLSSHNLVSFGDAENDLSLFELSELAVAVADAVPALRAVADVVAGQPGPAGVSEVLSQYWIAAEQQHALPDGKHAQSILLGKDEAGSPVTLSGAFLAGGNLGIFGDPSTGKSWVAGLLAEGLHHAGYQILVIDPEGDFRGLRILPEIVALEGSQTTLPLAPQVMTLLEWGNASVVVDLSTFPVTQRHSYVAELLENVRSLKERKFRPHWILLEEAQHFLHPQGNTVSRALAPMLPVGGLAFVSYRPDRLAGPVLTALDRCLLTGFRAPELAQAICRQFSLPEKTLNIPSGHVWLCGEKLVKLRPSARRVPHIRHLHKYLDKGLPPHKRFHFHDQRGFLGLEAASLFEFLQMLRTVPAGSLAYHQARGDFAAWATGSLGDDCLANYLHNLAQQRLDGEALREAMQQYVAIRYAELNPRD